MRSGYLITICLLSLFNLFFYQLGTIVTGLFVTRGNYKQYRNIVIVFIRDWGERHCSLERYLEIVQGGTSFPLRGRLPEEHSPVWRVRDTPGHRG